MFSRNNAWRGVGYPALVPHSVQNFAVGASTTPQFGQCFSRGTGVPHSGQNLAPGFSSFPH